MSLIKHEIFVKVFVIVIFVFVNFQSAQAQEKKQPPEPTMRELLNEVRLLRQTLQQINLNAYRSQIIIERLKIQRESITRLTRSLEETRAEISSLKESLPLMNDQTKHNDDLLIKETDTNKRAEVEIENKHLKTRIEQVKTRIEIFQTRETQLTNQLANEQNKLEELEKRLEEMEREIENEVKTQKIKDQP